MSLRTGKVVLTGAAGLVGQNLLVELESQGYEKQVAIDKNAYKVRILRQLLANAELDRADLAGHGAWEQTLDGFVPSKNVGGGMSRRAP